MEQLRVARAFKTVLEDLEDKRSVQSIQSLRSVTQSAQRLRELQGHRPGTGSQASSQGQQSEIPYVDAKDAEQPVMGSGPSTTPLSRYLEGAAAASSSKQQ